MDSDLRIRTALIVEDDFLSAEYHKSLCGDLGIEVVGIASNPTEAITMIMKLRPQYILMDVRLEAKLDGVDVAHIIYREGLRPSVIYITGNNDNNTLLRIMTDHPHRILIKPTQPSQLEEAFSSGHP